MTSNLPHPSDGPSAAHGGALVELMATPARRAELVAESVAWPSWELSPRELCDLELLLGGGFSPLRGFLGEADWRSVSETMRLADGTLWPIPVTLAVSEELAGRLAAGRRLALRDPEGGLLAALEVEDVYRPDVRAEAERVLGTASPEHPGAAALLRLDGRFYVGGRVEGVQAPAHYDFRALRATPRELREEFARRGWRRVVAFQTRNPMHRAHFELVRRAAREADARLLIHPVVGLTRPGDVDHFSRVRTYEALLPRFAPGSARLALLPLAMRMGGPREAVWHAIVRRNYGCSHFIVGRDHAGPGSDASGRPFYAPNAAQELALRHASEIGIEILPFREMKYVERLDAYLPEEEIPAGESALELKGTELRRRLATGGELPAWFTFPEVAAELRKTHPPRARQGFTVFFTGLSGAGKSTVANALLARLLERGDRSVTLLDGDLVRKHLSSELGFSKEHRDLNVRRIGFVAAEITRAGGAAICAPIAPYDAVRRDVRALVDPGGGFVLVHMSTPIEVCERRDRKGLYARARAGQVANFTGVSDPYETPGDAELTLDATDLAPEEAASRILAFLTTEGYLTS